jgi:hypothetical protein
MFIGGLSGFRLSTRTLSAPFLKYVTVMELVDRGFFRFKSSGDWMLLESVLMLELVVLRRGYVLLEVVGVSNGVFLNVVADLLTAGRTCGGVLVVVTLVEIKTLVLGGGDFMTVAKVFGVGDKDEDGENVEDE